MALRPVAAAVGGMVALLFCPASVLKAQEVAGSRQPRNMVVTLDGYGELPATLSSDDFEIGETRQHPSQVYSRDVRPNLLVIAFQQGVSKMKRSDELIAELQNLVKELPSNMRVVVVCLADEVQPGLLKSSRDRKRVVEELEAYRPQGRDSEAEAGARDDSVEGDAACPDRKTSSPYANLALVLEGSAEVPETAVQVLLVGNGRDWMENRSTERYSFSNPNANLAADRAREFGVAVWVLPVGGAFIAPVGNGYVGFTKLPRPGEEHLTDIEDRSRLHQMEANRTELFASGADLMEKVAHKSGGESLRRNDRVPIEEGLGEFRRLLDRQWVLEYRSDEPAESVRMLRKVPKTRLLAPGG